MSPFRFRRFSTRLLALLLGLLFTALALTYFFVSRANRSNALAHSEANLEVGAGIFDETIRQRIEYLGGSARVMSSDYAIKQSLDSDPATLSSLLESYTRRVRAPVIALLDPDGKLRANSDAAMENENVGPFRYLIGLAKDKDPAEDSGFAYLNNILHVLVVVPLYAPYPEIAAWFGLAFPIDRDFAQKIKDPTHLEVTFVSTDDPAKPRVLATTLPASLATLVARAMGDHRQAHDRIRTLDLPGERYVTLFKTANMLGDDPITVVLQRPLSAELAAARALESQVMYISLAALALAALAAIWISRDVSQPVLQLAEQTRVIAAGDYASRLTFDRADELGQLAGAMNAMSAGLAERDQVRDLLDKNVSPEVAAQLMRDGAALGGEEREVTILFADLRGFTTLSEKLEPRDLLALLNRYLDRMSAAVENQGGVIDKFIGDAIMALFGAPVSQGDAADRALAAALAMERALVALNAELAAEGRPPLAIGVGVNTARVIAGNIGSHRRLNYSVFGDGVNVASRLQSLTRTAEYHTNIITSAATLAARRKPGKISTRPLGTVAVKGRAEPVEIFAAA
ncbi:MAG: HAMP domain-containing protein [Opitutus sp.]|nr:HAMP domain-containing protein [Opitutus sp.]